MFLILLEPAGEPVEEGALPEDTVLGFEHPVIFVWEEEQLSFNAARMKGIEAELLIFPDENHWVLKPQNGILWQRTFFNWLDRWLK